jgi:hypothetical protein
MGAVQRRVQLEDVDSGAYIEVSVDDMYDDALRDDALDPLQSLERGA